MPPNLVPAVRPPDPRAELPPMPGGPQVLFRPGVEAAGGRPSQAVVKLKAIP